MGFNHEEHIVNKEVIEFKSKYLILVEWIHEKTGLEISDIDEVVTSAYNQSLKEELEEYCERLYDGEELDVE